MMRSLGPFRNTLPNSVQPASCRVRWSRESIMHLHARRVAIGLQAPDEAGADIRQAFVVEVDQILGACWASYVEKGGRLSSCARQQKT